MLSIRESGSAQKGSMISFPFLSFVGVAWIPRLLIHIQVPQQGLGYVSMWVCVAAGSDVELRLGI